MKHAVILAHPDRHSFNAAVAGLYRQAVAARGGEAILRDLYALNFDPRLRSEEIPRTGGFTPGTDVLAERRIIGDADVFALISPLWFYAPPAMMKGYVDRVFGMGFGYGRVREGANQPLLRGRRLIRFTSTGAPADWVEGEGALGAIRLIFDDHLARVCGLTVLEPVHFGGVTVGMRPDAVRAALAAVETAVDEMYRSRAA